MGRELTSDSFGSRPRGAFGCAMPAIDRFAFLAIFTSNPSKAGSEVNRSFDRRVVLGILGGSNAVENRPPGKARFRSRTAARVRPGRGRWPDQYATSTL